MSCENIHIVSGTPKLTLVGSYLLSLLKSPGRSKVAFSVGIVMGLYVLNGHAIGTFVFIFVFVLEYLP